MDGILATEGQAVRASRTENGGAEPDAPAMGPTWQQAMRKAIRDPETLCAELGLPASLASGAQAGAAEFPLFAPLEYVARMTPGDRDDPLLRQVLPLAQEGEKRPGFAADPLAEQAASLKPGLLQKYAGRALLVTTGACAIHCRYCFRRHFPYGSVPHSLDAWSDTLAYLRQHESIDEVLLSGGDPLSLVDELLARLVEAIAAIPHVQRIRVHTRFPIVIPQRITERLIATFRDCRPTCWFVVHVNHPQELDRPTLASLGRLIDAGIPVLNQAVLLRGVNDSVDVLEALCRRLVDQRIQPYYLHQLDRVQGAGHFEVDEATGLQLVAQLRERLPGYAVPQYVREIPAAASKTPLPIAGTEPIP